MRVRYHPAELHLFGRMRTALFRHGFAVPPSPKGKALALQIPICAHSGMHFIKLLKTSVITFFTNGIHK